MKTIIHINRHVLAKNRKTGERKPIITVKRGKTNRYAHEVQILGPSQVIYSPNKPLKCSAECWIETESEVIIINHFENTYKIQNGKSVKCKMVKGYPV